MTTCSSIDHVDVLVDYIMKHCLWQFHSRAWDRERQNREILGWAKATLQGQTETPEDRLERCHWVDGVMLARAYQESFPWINGLASAEVSELMDAVRAQLDHLTITGSLNRELHDHQY